MNFEFKPNRIRHFLIKSKPKDFGLISNAVSSFYKLWHIKKCHSFEVLHENKREKNIETIFGR